MARMCGAKAATQMVITDKIDKGMLFFWADEIVDYIYTGLREDKKPNDEPKETKPAADKPTDTGKKILPAMIDQIAKFCEKEGFNPDDVIQRAEKIRAKAIAEFSFDEGADLLKIVQSAGALQEFMGAD